MYVDNLCCYAYTRSIKSIQTGNDMKTITNPDDVCNRMLAPALSGLNMDHENVDRGVDFDTDPLGAIYELADTDHSYTDTASPEQRRTKRRDDFLADLLEAWGRLGLRA